MPNYATLSRQLAMCVMVLLQCQGRQINPTRVTTSGSDLAMASCFFLHLVLSQSTLAD